MSALESAPGIVNSAVYTGHVYHCRHQPRQHQFRYPMYMFQLDLDEIDQVERSVRFFSHRRFSPLRFKASDYLGHKSGSLKSTVLATVKGLGRGVSGIDRVVLLGQVRCFGFYFSPVNFFICFKGQTPVCMLAEVNNTPWGEKHSYLLDIKNPQAHEKAFHVSPFMDMDMQYRWQIEIADKTIHIRIENWRESKLFEADLMLTRQPINSQVVKTILKHWPMITFTIVRSIYWQALKLVAKRTPFYSHP